VIEVLPGCQRKVIKRWLSGLPADARSAVEVVSIDPSEAYRHAIWAALPDARIVCDRFHLVRGANTALDAVRRERQRDAKAKRPKGPGAAVNTFAGDPSSTKPDTGCSRPPSG
jgi:transposase